MQLQYDLIGSLPWMEQFHRTFDVLMDAALHGDVDSGALVINGAAHFYGLSAEGRTIQELVDAIRSLDQELEFQ